MSARKNAPARPLVFDFSTLAVGEEPAKPPKTGISQDKFDAMQAARRVYFDQRAALKLDAFEDVIATHAGDAETLTRAFYTWVAQLGVDYSIARIARDTGKGDVQTRESARVESTVKTVRNMSREEQLALLVELQASIKAGK